MTTYKVNIIEHNEKQVEIEAETEENAIEKAEKMYENGGILFDGSEDNNWQDYKIERAS